jgi:hypothetical protein
VTRWLSELQQKRRPVQSNHALVYQVAADQGLTVGGATDHNLVSILEHRHEDVVCEQPTTQAISHPDDCSAGWEAAERLKGRLGQAGSIRTGIEECPSLSSSIRFIGMGNSDGHNRGGRLTCLVIREFHRLLPHKPGGTQVEHARTLCNLCNEDSNVGIVPANASAQLKLVRIRVQHLAALDGHKLSGVSLEKLALQLFKSCLFSQQSSLPGPQIWCNEGRGRTAAVRLQPFLLSVPSGSA